MSYLRIFILLFVFPLVSAAPAHKFYVSITKIEYVKEKSSIQLITKIFTDDMEKALRQAYDPSIFLDSKKETEAADEAVKNYLLQKVKIKVNGKKVHLDYVGKEYDTDMVVAYFEVTGVTEVKNIEVENKVLMEIFPEQQNIIHLKTAKSRRSLLLKAEAPRGMLKF